MKKIYLFIFTKLITSASIAYAASECMMFKRHPRDPKPDYKVARHVNCACPCKKYKMLPHGECSYCGHYRYPRNWVIMTAEEVRMDQKNIKKPNIAPGKEKNYKILNKHVEPHIER